MTRLRLFYPLLSLLLGLVVVLGVYLRTNGNPTGQEWLDAFAVGYTAIFILSLLDHALAVIVPAWLCGYGVVREKDNRNAFLSAKASLIVGKQWNILLTAVIDFAAVMLRLLN